MLAGWSRAFDPVRSVPTIIYSQTGKDSMKRLTLVFVAVVAVAAAGEFLGVVPKGRPEELAGFVSVVGMMQDYVVVVGKDASSITLQASGRMLDEIVPEKRYLRVHLLSASESELRSAGKVLLFDGQEYLVVTDESGEQRIREMRAMVAPLNLEPWVISGKDTEDRILEAGLPKVWANPVIQQMVGLVSPDTVLSYVRRLQQYRNRYSTGDSCKAAAQWIAARLRAYGCDTVILQNHTTNHAPNVIGVKYGLLGRRNPYAIVSGHFDSYAASNAPGADDNASGTAATLEACRVMKNFRFNRDLKFIAWSGEEFGLYGSKYYASQARSRGDSILAVLNFDMIGYADVRPENLDLMAKNANPACGPLAQWFRAVADTYTTLRCTTQMMSDNQNSDHGPFWNNGYLALTGIEDFWPRNPHYHTPHDTIGAGYNDNAFCTEVTKAGVAALATLGQPVPQDRPWMSYLGSWISDSGGNANGRWEPGESVSVYVRLRNMGAQAAHGVSALLATSDPYITVQRSSVSYGDVPGQDSALCSEPYLVKAAAGTPKERVVQFGLTIVAAESTWTDGFSLTVGEILATDPVPDGPRLPPLYWAFDNIDRGYEQCPTFEWVEIKNKGTKLSFSHNDSVKVVNLPPEFGPLRFYGQRFTQLSISADGWICPGNNRQPYYSNTRLPGSSTPPGAVFLNWDDLYPDTSRTVWYWHDTANHRFIVEYDSVSYYAARTLRDKFQALFYDTTVAPGSGNNLIVVQYLTANGYTSSTVGIEDPARQIAIQYLCDGSLVRGAAGIAPGRAIAYCADEPTGMVENSPQVMTRRLGYAGPTILRNVLYLPFGLGYNINSESRVGLCPALLLDASGRKVTELGFGANDVRGLAPGVYFVVEPQAQTQAVRKVVVAR